MATAFHSTVEEEEAATAGVFEPARSLLIHDRGELVAHAGVFSRELSVPGGPLPAAHVTMVGVAPTHRRRGLLTRLMHRQLAEVAEPVAVLWASEGQIYPRFGYGMATRRVSFRANTREVALPATADPGRLRTVSLAQAREALMRVYESVWRDRPGWSSRDERWWSRLLADAPTDRRGGTELRATVHEGPHGPDGYALWRTKGDWSPSGPEGEVRVQEMVAADPQAHLALWQLLLSVDLTRWATLWLGGLDDPLLQAAGEPRRVGVTLGDGLYVRLVDLPAALTGRRYATDVDVVLEVGDSLVPANAGRWRLRADGDKVTCARTDQAADLACDTSTLAAAYLGGVSLAALALAGRVRELRPGVLPAVSTAFGWHRAPAGLESF